MGSASELEYQLSLAADLEFLDQPTYVDLAMKLASVRKMLASLLNTLSRSAADSR
jgi:four helix bundle protein